MNIKESINHLENLKFAFNRVEILKIEKKDIKALEVAIEVMNTSMNLVNSLSSFNEKNDITNKKSTCHCCLETENLTNVLGLNLCPACLEVFNNYRKIIDTLR